MSDDSGYIDERREAEKADRMTRPCGRPASWFEAEQHLCDEHRPPLSGVACFFGWTCEAPIPDAPACTCEPEGRGLHRDCPRHGYLYAPKRTPTVAECSCNCHRNCWCACEETPPTPALGSFDIEAFLTKWLDEHVRLCGHGNVHITCGDCNAHNFPRGPR